MPMSSSDNQIVAMRRGIVAREALTGIACPRLWTNQGRSVTLLKHLRDWNTRRVGNRPILLKNSAWALDPMISGDIDDPPRDLRRSRRVLAGRLMHGRPLPPSRVSFS